MSADPEIVVTPADRQAVCDSHSVPRSNPTWVATGDRGLASWNRQAYAIARARTMAAFEERVRCLKACYDAGAIGAGANVANVPWFASESLLSSSAPTDEQFRALVLRGWQS